MKKIAIMPGHGGSDVGAVNSYYNKKESDFNWEEALVLAKKLEKTGYQVLICRKESVDEKLSTMQKRANNFKADLCLCLHHNAFKKKTRGWGVYYTSSASESLAKVIYNSYKKEMSIGEHGKGLKVSSKESYPRVYSCIKRCKMPTVLLESCFIDNNEDCKWLIDNGWLEVVDALYRSVLTYFGEEEETFTDSKDREEFTPHDLCELYVDLYKEGNIDTPNLMAITFAQWMLESGWLESDLAQDAYNFGGLKDRPEVERGGNYKYKNELYEKFDSPEDFIKGYWEFLDRAPYKKFNENKIKYKDDPVGFIKLIGPIYCPTDGYLEKVLSTYNSQHFKQYRNYLEKAVDNFQEEDVTYILGFAKKGYFIPFDESLSNKIKLKLSTNSMSNKTSPENGKIEIDSYEGRAILIRGTMGSDWVYGAEIVEVAGLILSNLMLNKLI